jgi:predicted nucleotidyltransferase
MGVFMTALLRTAQEQMTENLIAKMLAGSHAYGTNIATSDTDYRGIFVANPINVRTPFFPMGEVDDASEEDTKIYELSKFMKLALDCNPNVVELLWTDMADVTVTTPAYELLRRHAGELLSRKVAFTTSGYALAQLKRIKGHNKWLTNPQPEAKPQQVDYMTLVHNFTSAKLFKVSLREYRMNHRLVPFSGDTFGVYQIDGYTPYNVETGNLNTEYEGDTDVLGVPLFIIKFNRSVYEGAKETWTNYWTWKKNRNEKRSVLEEQFGYDTKHAMHLVRLLRMGAEVLQTGVLQVRRPDAAELLSIRDGAWSYEQVVAYAEDMDRLVREELLQKSILPAKPNVKLAATLMLEIQDMVWSQ